AYESPQSPADGFDTGAAREFLASMRLHPVLGSSLLRSLAEQTAPVDPAEVKAHIERAGRNYADEVAHAQFALNQAAGKFKVKAQQLDANSLVMLAIHGRQLHRHSGGR